MGKITLRVLSSGEFWKGLSSPIPSVHQIKLREKGTPDPTQAQLHRSWGAAVHPCICIASYMLTTKLGSLKGSGLAAFSTGPELNSEDAILFSLTASMLTPLKHRKGKKNLWSHSRWVLHICFQQDRHARGPGLQQAPALEAGEHCRHKQEPGCRAQGLLSCASCLITLTTAKEVWLSSSYRKLRHRRTGLRLHSTAHTFPI